MAIIYGLNGNSCLHLQTPEEAKAATELMKRGAFLPNNEESQMGCYKDSVLQFSTQEAAENALGLIERMI